MSKQKQSPFNIQNLTLLVITVLIFISCGKNSSKALLNNDGPKARISQIVGGRVSEVNEWNSVVLIATPNSTTLSDGILESGVLIAEDIVLTTGHGIVDYKAADLAIYIGNNCKNGNCLNERLYQVKKVYTHPYYVDSKRNDDHDFSFLVLKEKIDPLIATPAKLPQTLTEAQQLYQIGNKGIAVGFGKDVNGKYGIQKQVQLELTRQNRSYTESINWDAGKGIHDGDSGGGFFVKNRNGEYILAGGLFEGVKGRCSSFGKIHLALAWMYSILSDSYFQKGEKINSIEFITKSIEIQPDNRDWYLKRSNIYKAIGELKKSELDLSVGASLHSYSETETMLSNLTVLQKGNYEKSKTLIRESITRGGDIDAMIISGTLKSDLDWEESGRTALMIAARQGNLAFVRFLIDEMKADVNVSSWKDKMTALHFAIEENHINIIKYLLSVQGINIHIKSQYSNTAYILSLNIERRREVYNIFNDWIYEKEQLIRAVKKNDLSKVESLLVIGTDINYQDSEGKSALMYAIEERKECFDINKDSGI
ncbi:MAG: ankyrin repeat domain-containing protein [Bacteriovoracaceae bacterium]|nr:ankyrin repeat domain-containing protein [Bacteriovoracaceae bacterium]